MKKFTKRLVLPLALAISAATFVPAQASGVLGAAIMIDKYLKKEAQVALSTPGHTSWCVQKYPGYRPHINNFIKPNGRVQYCASPYYTPPWMKFGANAMQ